MALNDYGIIEAEGFIGKTPEEAILNLRKISKIGMAEEDNIILEIMREKVL
jgi:L-cysteine desulfidase